MVKASVGLVRVLGSIIGVLATFLAFASFVSADTTASLLPNGEGNYLQWTPKSGVTHYTMVDESTCNGTTDHVSTGTTGNRDSYTVDISSVPTNALITQISLTPCASRNSNGGGSATMNVFYRWSGANSSDAGAYALTGTTPTGLSVTNFSGLALTKGVSSTLEIGAIYSSGTKGARLGRIAAVITYTPVPAAPSSLSASAVSSSQINLSWTDASSNETGFEVERSLNGTDFSLASTTGANTTAYSDTGLSASTLYYYRVSATNAAGDSSDSNTVSTTTLDVPPPPPSAPSGLSATTKSANRIDLSWMDNSGDETGFKVERATSTGGLWVNIATTSADVTSYNSTGLATSSQYFYRVRAYSGAGNSGYSNTAVATTTNGTPLDPSGLMGTASTSATQGDAILTWTDNSVDETTFKIERATTSASGPYSQIFTVGANVTTAMDANRPNGTYYYRVRAANGALNSGYTNTASVTIDVVLPDAPSDLTVSTTTVGTTTVADLSWTDNSSNETSFRIDRSSDGITFFEHGSVSADVTTWQQTVFPGTTYYYRVRATNGGGSSDPSNVFEITA